MGCCWTAGQSSTLNGSPGEPYRTGTGVLALAGYVDCTDPDCYTPYSGPHANEVAYLVGWGTEHERLFRSEHSKQAIAYASSAPGRLRNHRVMLHDLPVRAVEDLLAS